MFASRRTVAFVLVLTAVSALGAACSSSAGTAKTQPEPKGEDSVSIGYGREAKRDVTTAVASLSDEQLSNQRVARVEELLRRQRRQRAGA